MSPTVTRAVPAIVFCFIAAILLLIVSVSAPKWDAISFLNVDGISFGVFGYTGSRVHVGYDLPIEVPDSNIANTFHNLTYILVLYPIAAGLSGFTILCPPGKVVTSVIAGLASACTIVAWAVSMTLFSNAKHRIEGASLGNGNWIGLSALIVSLWGFFLAVWGTGAFGRCRREETKGW
ncbi:hypothetical protein BV22DRAFT_1006783 [Leucogyrophana mollusca]|uniref:Uncharacterized protein n=1 Tax=Leucogyrophana mollusca TaxID=85980 RepID=A0ACB8BSA6_9AGAM|nr:hypothetical protein BV22DRAFT_1006783 [Leucogyrophana mollusca]